MDSQLIYNEIQDYVKNNKNRKILNKSSLSTKNHTQVPLINKRNKGNFFNTKKTSQLLVAEDTRDRRQFEDNDLSFDDSVTVSKFIKKFKIFDSKS